MLATIGSACAVSSSPLNDEEGSFMGVHQGVFDLSRQSIVLDDGGHAQLVATRDVGDLGMGVRVLQRLDQTTGSRAYAYGEFVASDVHPPVRTTERRLDLGLDRCLVRPDALALLESKMGIRFERLEQAAARDAADARRHVFGGALDRGPNAFQRGRASRVAIP